VLVATYLQGDATTYDELLSQLRPQAPDAAASTSAAAAHQPSLIYPLMLALTTHASLLSSTAHRSLIEAVIHFPWSTADEDFVETYMRFIGVLVSLRMEWLGEVVKRCVKGLKFRKCSLPDDALPDEPTDADREFPLSLPEPHFKQLLPPSNSSTTAPLTRGALYHRQHVLLARLLALIPTLPSLLLPLLLAGFPPKREPRVAHTVWIRNVLRVSGYCPTVGERVWGAVLGRALQMDVSMGQLSDDAVNAAQRLSLTLRLHGRTGRDPGRVGRARGCRRRQRRCLLGCVVRLGRRRRPVRKARRARTHRPRRGRRRARGGGRRPGRLGLGKRRQRRGGGAERERGGSAETPAGHQGDGGQA
jgi:hypothetical protein